MKRARLIIGLLGLWGLATTNYACSGAFVREVRDAAISGVAGFVEGEVGTILTEAVGP
jgi:hypothetical protein